MKRKVQEKKPAPILDAFKALGLSTRAKDEEIDAAYRRLAKKYHPDLNHAPDAGEKFRRIVAAHEELTKGTAASSLEEEVRWATQAWCPPFVSTHVPKNKWKRKETRSKNRRLVRNDFKLGLGYIPNPEKRKVDNKKTHERARATPEKRAADNRRRRRGRKLIS